MASQSAPFVYFIRKGRYLYIGETQQTVVIRWGDHLSEKGSFRNALKKFDPEILDNEEEVSFFLFFCDEIQQNVPLISMRRTTQYLEHLLHLRVVTHPKLGPRFDLISETKKTAPKFCDLAGIEEVADEIITHMTGEL